MKARERHVKVAVRLELQRQHAALAVTHRLDEFGAHRARQAHAVQVCCRVAGARERCIGDAFHRAGVDYVPAAVGAVSETRDRIAPHVALFGKQRRQHAEGAGLVLPVDRAVHVRRVAARQVGIAGADADHARQVLLGRQGFARGDVDGAGQAAIDDIGLGGLVDDSLLQHVRWHQGQAGRARARALVGDVPVGAADGVAIEDDQRHVRIGAAHRDLLGLVVVGAHRHAGETLQRIGQVLVWHLADVFGRDDLDVSRRIALDRQRPGQRGADARHFHGLHRHGGCGVLVLRLRLRQHWQRGKAPDGHRYGRGKRLLLEHHLSPGKGAILGKVRQICQCLCRVFMMDCHHE